MAAKRGRPRVYDISAKDIKQAGLLASWGMNLDRIAAMIGLNARLLDRRIAEDKKKFRDGEPGQNEENNLYVAIEKSRAASDGMLAQTAFEMATDKKNPGMTIFLCKVRLGWKETMTVEHTGNDGKPIQVEDPRGKLKALLRNPEAAKAAEALAKALNGNTSTSQS